MMMFIIYVLLCLLVTALAKNSGRSGTLWFFISFIISPLAGVVLWFIFYLVNGKVEDGPRLFQTWDNALDYVREGHESLLTLAQQYELADNIYHNAATYDECDRIISTFIKR